jgi:hypothetical protein
MKEKQIKTTLRFHITPGRMAAIKKRNNGVPEVHTCNPSYSGGKDQEDHSSKSSPENSLWDPISKIPNLKQGLLEWMKV